MSQRNSPGNRHGFTLSELLLNTLILGFVFTATLILYMMLDRMWKEDLALSELSQSSSIAFEKMIRGTLANEGLQAARSITAPQSGMSSDAVEYKDINDLTKRFYYSNGKIYPASGTPILSEVSSIAFSKVGNILQLDLSTHRYITNKEIKFHIQTKVKPRN